MSEENKPLTFKENEIGWLVFKIVFFIICFIVASIKGANWSEFLLLGFIAFFMCGMTVVAIWEDSNIKIWEDKE